MFPAHKLLLIHHVSGQVLGIILRHESVALQRRCSIRSRHVSNCLKVRLKETRPTRKVQLWDGGKCASAGGNSERCANPANVTFHLSCDS